jgi:hypothetical protein
VPRISHSQQSLPSPATESHGCNHKQPHKFESDHFEPSHTNLAFHSASAIASCRARSASLISSACCFSTFARRRSLRPRFVIAKSILPRTVSEHVLKQRNSTSRLMAERRGVSLRLLYRAKTGNRNRMPDSHPPEEMGLPQGATPLQEKGRPEGRAFLLVIKVLINAPPQGDIRPISTCPVIRLIGT